MQKNKAVRDNTLYKTPFSKAYWVQAASEFKRLDMLIFAALMIALRVALKPLSIPLAADLRVNSAFLVNAFGAMVFGPVVASVAAAVSDTLGCILFPTGTYFFPFIFVEIAGSLIFALFLYRTEVSTWRVILSRFCICFFVNIVLNTPIMMLYYQLVMGRYYPLFDMLRIVKNLVMFPIESVVLTVFLRVVIPPMQKLGYVPGNTNRLQFSKKNIITLAVLFVVGVASVAGYAVYDYNTKSFSAAYTAAERLRRNSEMNAWVTGEQQRYAEDELVTIIESARSQVGNPEMTYELAVYRIDDDAFQARQEGDPAYTLDTLRGYSKSKAAADGALVRIGSATAVTDKKTEDRLRISCEWTEENQP